MPIFRGCYARSGGIEVTDSPSPSPPFIKWDYSAKLEDGSDYNFQTLRTSVPYLKFAKYLVENPPNEQPFRPHDPALGDAAAALKIYKRDVETWVGMRMMNEIASGNESDEADIFALVMNELHELPWYPGSEWRGFYLLQPMAKRIRPAKKKSWAFEAMGQEVPYIRADGMKGYWKEPTFEEWEQWNTRLTVNAIVATTERMAEATLSGRQIGQLTKDQQRSMIGLTIRSIDAALPSDAAPSKKELPSGIHRSQEE